MSSLNGKRVNSEVEQLKLMCEAMGYKNDMSTLDDAGRECTQRVWYQKRRVLAVQKKAGDIKGKVDQIDGDYLMELRKEASAKLDAVLDKTGEKLTSEARNVSRNACGVSRVAALQYLIEARMRQELKLAEITCNGNEQLVDEIVAAHKVP